MPRDTVQDRAIASSFLKGLDLMTVLARRPEGMTIPALVARMKLPRTSILRMLHTLEIYGLVVRTDGVWRSTDRFRDWCSRDMYGEIRARYRDALERIAKAVGELVVLVVGEGEGVRYIDSVQSPHRLAADSMKSSLYPLQSTAAGKLLLSRRPDLCARIRDRRLLQEIDAARREGVAWNRGESDPKVICVAVWAGGPSNTTPLICIQWPIIRFSETKAASALAKVRHVLGSQW